MSMRIAVVGANGRAGLEVVKQGLKRGHEVSAIARRPAAVGLEHENLKIHAADVLDPVALAPAFARVDAVVSALGIGTSRAATVVYSDGIKNIVSLMGPSGPKSLVVISATPVGPCAEHPFIDRRIAMPILESFLHATYQDMRRMEAVLQESDVDWISVRPPRLVNRALPAPSEHRATCSRSKDHRRGPRHGVARRHRPEGSLPEGVVRGQLESARCKVTGPAPARSVQMLK